MNRYSITWKAYRMDEKGRKNQTSGEIVFEAIGLNLPQIHDRVCQLVRAEHPELAATPILISRFDQRKVKEVA